MKDIFFLDCTLRDGAHVVSGEFKKPCIVNIIKKLTKAKADIVEFGFLKTCEYNPDKVFFPTIDEAYSMLDEVDVPTSSEDAPIYALMARADEYDIRKLPRANGKIPMIRVAFYYDYLDKGIDFVRKAMELGYICSINLINTPGSSLEELKVFVEKANGVKPFAVSIVDTFGVLDLEELNEIIKLYDNELDLSIRLGLHVHENMSLTYLLAREFLKETKKERRVIVDGSLMGIGRSPGNLCTELVTSFLNEKYQKNYDMRLIMAAISESIKPLKNIYKWGYAPEYVLSAKHRVHRSYAEYLETKGVNLDEINELLSRIDGEHAKKYNKQYIDGVMKLWGTV